ncbi:thioredoxin-like protein [Mytilinidion resinicola]|uniref:Thioredoxin-like protein n=1 Tax=Mytilinidion resinicola TaxID=574789 RepID=A0A6A6YF51_9PEZI|nr:thioredoxin-like protein [Mytilinidion resinicola]KAF2806487.1 thioredoxin-like protein [Mytilinidion resinicola]
MATPTQITAPLHLTTLAGSTTYVLADFYADWCGPCKTIAPFYSQLSTQNTVPGSLAFVKINVDDQTELASKYSIRTIPTFILFKNGKVEQTLNAVNPNALKAIVQKVKAELAAEAKKAEAKKAEAPKEVVEEKTVSGSYGMTGGNGWKTSLN